jgi:DNA-binding NtrC family response regulator
MAKILFVDDDASLREVIGFALGEQGHEVQALADGHRAIAALATFRPDLVITDLKMPGIDGMEVLRRVLETDPTVPVILLTAYGTIEEAVEAMKLGAYDYLAKPYNREELKLTVESALERRRLLNENRTLRARLREQGEKIELVHASPAMEQVLQLVGRIAPTDATVLLSGESGTGKDVIAQLLHARSERWERAFVAVNCAAIPKDLMESELFGYARGAFTGAVKDKPGKFQRADGGTLFLDEVGELPADLQTKLLRVLESRQVDVVGGQQPVQVDVRIIAATNSDLGAAVREGRFRGDLFYRLNVIPIRIPPLRERPEDIPALWEYFLRRHAPGTRVRTSPELVRALLGRPWPGNVRELGNLCQRMVLLRSSDLLTNEDLAAAESEGLASGGPPAGGSVREGDPAAKGGNGPGRGDGSGLGRFLGELPSGRLPLLEVEREIIVRALAKHRGNQTRTAEYLGIPRHVLLYRLEKFGIE